VNSQTGVGVGGISVGVGVGGIGVFVAVGGIGVGVSFDPKGINKQLVSTKRVSIKKAK